MRHTSNNEQKTKQDREYLHNMIATFLVHFLVEFSIRSIVRASRFFSPGQEEDNEQQAESNEQKGATNDNAREQALIIGRIRKFTVPGGRERSGSGDRHQRTSHYSREDCTKDTSVKRSDWKQLLRLVQIRVIARFLARSRYLCGFGTQTSGL